MYMYMYVLRVMLVSGLIDKCMYTCNESLLWGLQDYPFSEFRPSSRMYAILSCVSVYLS